MSQESAYSKATVDAMIADRVKGIMERHKGELAAKDKALADLKTEFEASKVTDVKKREGIIRALAAKYGAKNAELLKGLELASFDKIVGILAGLTEQEIELTPEQVDACRYAGIDPAVVQRDQQEHLKEQARRKTEGPRKLSKELTSEQEEIALRLSRQTVNGKPMMDIDALRKHHRERVEKEEREAKEGYRPRGGRAAWEAAFGSGEGD